MLDKVTDRVSLEPVCVSVYLVDDGKVDVVRSRRTECNAATARAYCEARGSHDVLPEQTHFKIKPQISQISGFATHFKIKPQISQISGFATQSLKSADLRLKILQYVLEYSELLYCK